MFRLELQFAMKKITGASQKFAPIKQGMVLTILKFQGREPWDLDMLSGHPGRKRKTGWR